MDAKICKALRQYAGFSESQCAKLESFLTNWPGCLSGGFVLWALCDCPQAWRPSDIDVFILGDICPQTFAEKIGGRLASANDQRMQEKRLPITRSSMPNALSARSCQTFVVFPSEAKDKKSDEKWVLFDIVCVDLSRSYQAVSLFDWIQRSFDVSLCKGVWPMRVEDTSRNPGRTVLSAIDINRNVMEEVQNKSGTFACNDVSMERQAARFQKYGQRGFTMRCEWPGPDYLQKTAWPTDATAAFWLPENNPNLSWIQPIAYDTCFVRCGPTQPGDMSALVYVTPNTEHKKTGEWVHFEDGSAEFLLNDKDDDSLRVRSPSEWDPRFVAVRGAVPPSTVNGCTWTKWPITYLPDEFVPLNNREMDVKRTPREIHVAFVDTAELNKLVANAKQTCTLGKHCFWSHRDFIHVHYGEKSERTLLVSNKIVRLSKNPISTSEHQSVTELRKYVCDNVAFMITEYLPVSCAWPMVWKTRRWMNRMHASWFQMHLYRTYKQLVYDAKTGKPVQFRVELADYQRTHERLPQQASGLLLDILAYDLIDAVENSAGASFRDICARGYGWFEFDFAPDACAFTLNWEGDQPAEAQTYSSPSPLAVYLAVERIMFQLHHAKHLRVYHRVEKFPFYKDTVQFVFLDLYPLRATMTLRHSPYTISQVKPDDLGLKGHPCTMVDCSSILCVMSVCGAKSHFHVPPKCHHPHPVHVYIPAETDEPASKRQRIHL